MTSDKTIKGDFDTAAQRAVYYAPTQGHPHHMVYLINDMGVPTKAFKFDKESTSFDHLKDKERIMFTSGAPYPDGTIEFDIQQLS